MTVYNVIPGVEYEGCQFPVAAYHDESTATALAERLEAELQEPRDQRPTHAALGLNTYPDWYAVAHVTVLDAPQEA